MPARPYPIEIPPSTNGWSGYLITKGLCSADSNIDRKFKQHLQTHLELRQKQQQRHIHPHQTYTQNKESLTHQILQPPSLRTLQLPLGLPPLGRTLSPQTRRQQQ